MRSLIFLSLFLFSFLSANNYLSIKQTIQEHQKRLGLSPQEIEYINRKKTILVSNEPDYEPYDFFKNGKAMGYSIDLTNLLLKNTGLDIKYVTKPWNDLINDLESKKIDLVHTIYKTPQREKKYNFSFGYSKVIQSYIIRKNSDDIDEIQQLFGKKVGVCKGWIEEKFFNKYPKIQKIYFNNLEEKLDALSLGEIDAIINSDNVANYYINKYGYQNLKLSEAVKKVSAKQLNDHYFVSLKEDFILISILNKAYDHVSIKDLHNLNAKWFGENKEKQISFTQQEQEWLSKKIPVTYVYDIDWEPFEWKSKTNTHTGIVADILDLIAKKSGILFEPIHTNSWEKAVLLAQNNKVDMFSAIPYDTKRAQYMDFTKNDIFQYNAVLLKNTNDNTTYKDLKNSISNKTIAIVKSSSLGASIKDRYPKANYIEVLKTKDGLKKLQNGEVDLFAINSQTAHLMIYHQRYTDLEIAKELDLIYNLKIAVSKNMPKEVLSIIDKTLGSISEKEIEAIYDKWIHPIRVQKEIPWDIIIYIVLFLSLVMGLVLHRQKILNQKNKQIKMLYESTEVEKYKLETLIQNIPDLLWIKDEKGVYLTCNNRFEELYCSTKDQIVGKTDYDFVDKKLADFFTKHDKIAMNADGAVANYEEVVFQSDGHKEHLHTIKVKIKDTEGNILGILGIGRDMTKNIELTNKLKALNETLELKVEEKTRELEEQNLHLEERVKQEVQKGIKQELILSEQQKHAQMGLMIGNIAHQFRQPLSIISTISSGVLANIELGITQDKELMSESMNHIIERTQYLSDTITIFRNFLKEDKIYREVVLQSRIDIALRIVSMSLKDSAVELINNINYERKIYIKLVLGELVEVLINIINNAKDILLEKQIKDPWIKIDIENKDDSSIISIEDNGGGIPQEYLPHIYDQYFTTKDEDKGTGLGLYMSKQIIEESLKGKLSVINTENGAKFLIELASSTTRSF